MTNQNTKEPTLEEVVNMLAYTIENLKKFASKRGARGVNIYRTRNEALDEVIVLVKAMAPQVLTTAKQQGVEQGKREERERIMALKKRVLCVVTETESKMDVVKPVDVVFLEALTPPTN